MIQVIEQFIVNYMYISKLRTGVELSYFCELQLFGLTLWKKKEEKKKKRETVSGCKCHKTIIILEKSGSTERITDWKKGTLICYWYNQGFRPIHRPGLQQVQVHVQVYFCFHLTFNNLQVQIKAYILLQKVNGDVDAIKKAGRVTDSTQHVT